MPVLSGVIADVTNTPITADDLVELFVKVPAPRVSGSGTDQIITMTTVTVDVDPVNGSFSVNLDPGVAILVVRTFQSHDTFNLAVRENMTTIREAIIEDLGSLPELEASELVALAAQVRADAIAVTGMHDAVEAWYPTIEGWHEDVEGWHSEVAANTKIAHDSAGLAVLAAAHAGRIFGTGSPEGVVDAPVGTIYVDTPTGVMWHKATQEGNLSGWSLFETGDGVVLAAAEYAQEALDTAAAIEGMATAQDGAIASLLSGTGVTATALNARFAGTVARSAPRGATKTLYVRANGNDSNSGETVATAFREIQPALDKLAQYGPVFTGKLVIDVGAGTYKGGIRLPLIRGNAQDDYLRIVGPNVGGHPNVPTAIVSKSADPSAAYAVMATEGWTLWLENLKFEGDFNVSLDIRGGGTINQRNLHIDGAKVGASYTGGVSYFSQGGIFSNCSTYAIQEMSQTQRSFNGGNGNGTIFRNCAYGLYGKAYSSGHIDHSVFEDCPVAIHLDRSSANLNLVSISGSTIAGLSLKDSEVHNESQIIWGTTPGRRIVSFGSATSESDSWGWSNPSVRSGVKPPITMLRSKYESVQVEGTTSFVTVATWGGLLPADRFAMQGRKLRVVIIGRMQTVSTDDVVVQLRIGSNTAMSLALPTGQPVGYFQATWEMTCIADGNNQRFLGRVETTNGFNQIYHNTNTINLTDGNQTLSVRAQTRSAVDRISVEQVEVYG